MPEFTKKKKCIEIKLKFLMSKLYFRRLSAEKNQRNGIDLYVEGLSEKDFGSHVCTYI
jgi:hypothetical protein